jgi:chemotaxis protein methyltransferase CheR
MRHEEHTRALIGALGAFGLDLNRYSVAHAVDYMARFPDPNVWSCSEARSSLISTFAIGETTFMRHPEHFQAVRTLAPELCERRGGAPLRVFSAGCSSGEEAYSLAATLAQSGRPAFELLAWDMNPEAVARAVTGEYRPWSLRGVDAAATRGWLEPAPCGVRIESWLRGLVRFDVGNLYTDAFPADLDLIFCRNVLLYFRRDAAARVLARMADSLRPGGALFLGYYDPTPAPETGLVQEQLAGATYYRKRNAGVQAASPPQPIRGLAEASLVAQAVQLGRVRRSLPPAAFSAEAGLETRMEIVRQLVDQQRAHQALSVLADLRASTPLRPELHILTALAAEDAGDMRLMLDAARKACFLLPDHPGPNYFLSVAFVRNGELRRAAVHRRIAAAALKSQQHPSSVVEYSEGLTVSQLRRLVGAISR